jgi:hypothetical protein
MTAKPGDKLTMVATADWLEEAAHMLWRLPKVIALAFLLVAMVLIHDGVVRRRAKKWKGARNFNPQKTQANAGFATHCDLKRAKYYKPEA